MRKKSGKKTQISSRRLMEASLERVEQNDLRKEEDGFSGFLERLSAEERR